MAYPHGMDVGERPQTLVHVELDLEHWHLCLNLCEGARTAIEVFRDIFEDEVKVYFALLIRRQLFHKKTKEGCTLSPAPKK